MPIKEIYGNIFNTSLQTIVNTVNCDGVMGKGIALEFKLRYKKMYENYVSICEKKLLSPGKLLLWQKSDPWILNFPTKYHWKNPSKIEYIESGLKKFISMYETKEITSIAFPILGVSSGGLVETDVLKLMNFHLKPLNNLIVEIYHFDPDISDNLFTNFYQRTLNFQLVDFINQLDLSKKQAFILKKALNTRSIRNMQDIQKLEGIGEKSIEKIYEFIRISSRRIITMDERQPLLL